MFSNGIIKWNVQVEMSIQLHRQIQPTARNRREENVEEVLIDASFSLELDSELHEQLKTWQHCQTVHHIQEQVLTHSTRLRVNENQSRR